MRTTSSSPPVLVVIPEGYLRRFVVAVLEKAGYEVSGVETGAMALVAGAGAEVVITKLSLPDMTGPELAGRLRARGGESGFLFVSGLAARGPAGVPRSAFLAMPFGIPELLEAVERLAETSGERPDRDS